MTAEDMIIQLYSIADTADTVIHNYENVKPEANPCVLAGMARADLAYVANAIRDVLSGESMV